MNPGNDVDSYVEILWASSLELGMEVRDVAFIDFKSMWNMQKRRTYGAKIYVIEVGQSVTLRYNSSNT